MDKPYFSYDNDIKYIDYGYTHSDYIIVEDNLLPKYMALESNKPLGEQSTVIFKPDYVNFNIVWDMVFGRTYDVLVNLPLYRTIIFYDNVFRKTLNIQVVGLTVEYLKTLANMVKLYRVALTIRVIY